MKKGLSLLLIFVLAFAFMPSTWAAKSPKVVIEPQYNDISPFVDGFAFVEVDGLWGLIDTQGNYIVEPRYEGNGYEYYEFREGLARVNADWMWGFIDQQGEEIIPLQYDWASHFSEGLAMVLVDEKYGFIDRTGTMVIPPIYENATVFEDGVSVVIESYETGKISIINKSGKKVADTPYFNESIMYGEEVFNEGLFWVSDEKGRFGAIDRTGKIVVPVKYDYPGHVLIGYDTYRFYEGLAIVGQNLERIIINTKGEELVRLSQYDGISYFTIGDFSEGLAPVSVYDKTGYIDTAGKEAIAPVYDSSFYFFDGIAPFTKDGLFGLLDKGGKEILKPQYEYIDYFHNGRAAVQKDGKWGFIDQAGNEVIKPQYDDWFIGGEQAYYFEEGLAFVKKGDHFGYIDLNGNVVIPFQYEDAWYFENGLAAVKLGGKWGVIALPVDEPSAWALAEVEEAVSLGLIPEDMQYGYEDHITRADFSRLVMNMLSVKHGKTVDQLLVHYGKIIDETVFTDTKDRTILAANALGIVGGIGNGLFNPDGSITRQEAAAMLTRTASLFDLKSGNSAEAYADDSIISSWAKESVAFVTSVQDKKSGALIMGGTGNNKFSPDGSYTRQQAFITMKRLFNAL